MTTTPGSDYDVAMTTPERSDDEMDRSAWNSAPSSPQSPQTSPTAEKEATFIEEFKNKVLESKADQWLYTSSVRFSLCLFAYCLLSF